MTEVESLAPDPEEDVELGEEVAARRRVGSSVVAVRVPADLLRRVDIFARDHGMTVSDVIRQGAEQLVGARVHFATGARIYSSTVLIGSSSLGGYLRSVDAVSRSPSVESSITVAG